MKAHHQYTTEIRDKFGYLATWAPNFPLRLGDVGLVEDRVFTPVTTLSRLGIKFESREPGSASDSEHSSAGSVTMTFKASGQAPATGSLLSTAEAGITIEFRTENSVVFQAAGCRETIMLGLDELGKTIIAKHKANEWKPEFVVVTSVVEAGAATIIISSGSNGQFELATSGSAGSAGLSLVDVKGSFRIVSARNVGTKIVATSGLTPLFRASSLCKSIFGDTFKSRGTSAETLDRSSGLRFAEIDYSDEDFQRTT